MNYVVPNKKIANLWSCFCDIVILLNVTMVTQMSLRQLNMLAPSCTIRIPQPAAWFSLCPCSCWCQRRWRVHTLSWAIKWSQSFKHEFQLTKCYLNDSNISNLLIPFSSEWFRTGCDRRDPPKMNMFFYEMLGCELLLNHGSCMGLGQSRVSCDCMSPSPSDAHSTAQSYLMMMGGKSEACGFPVSEIRAKRKRFA